MIDALIAVYFCMGLILVLFGPAKLSIAREVEKVKDFKRSSRSRSMQVSKNKIILFRLMITAGFIVMWPFFLPGVLRDNRRFGEIGLFNNVKRSINGKKFKCPKCNKKEAVQILYGYPSKETLQAWHNKEVELGGCIVGREMFNRKCINCNYQW
jgi:DNA-directed RNA polymerase subunit M/transcription elongation factor TFIIS